MARWPRFQPAADRRLVKGLTSGDDSFLATLYDRYAERLYDYSWSQLGEVRASANVVHDTLIDACRRVGRLRDRDRLRAWLYASVRRRCILYGRDSAALAWECTPAVESLPSEDARQAALRALADGVRSGTGSAGGEGGAGDTAGRSGNGGDDGTDDHDVIVGRVVRPRFATRIGSRAATAPASGARAAGIGRRGTTRRAIRPANALSDTATATASAVSAVSAASTAGSREATDDPTASAAPPSAAMPEVGSGYARAASLEELCEWIQKAFQKLPPAEQETLFLATRHDLDVVDLSVILGESQRRVQARLSRAREWMTDTVPAIDPDVALDVHAAPTPPAELRTRVLHAGSDPELAAHRADIVARSGGLGPDGFPRQPGARVPFARRWIFAGGGLSAALTGVALVVMLIGSSTAGDPHIWPFGSSPTPKPSESVPSTERPPRSPKQNAPEPVAPSPAVPDDNGSLRGNEPTPSPPPTSAPPTGPGVLTVEPQTIQLMGRDETAEIRLHAEQADVSWTATDTSPLITLSAERGTVRADSEEVVELRLHRTLVQLPGAAKVTVTDDTGREHVIQVRWSLSLL